MIGEPFIQLKKVKSTNTYAKREAQIGKALHGAVYMAHTQTVGKGQWGREWQAAAGENITLSVVLNPLEQYAHQSFFCSMVLAVGAYQFLKTYVDDALSIKWPNDLYWRNRKIGGILIENIYHGKQWNWIIGGVGINVNQTVFNGLLNKAVSIRQITGKKFDIIFLARELCFMINGVWESLQQKGLEWLRSLYNEVLFCKNQTAIFKKDNIQFEAKVIGVDIMGNLILEHGTTEHVAYGRVEWIL